MENKRDVVLNLFNEISSKIDKKKKILLYRDLMKNTNTYKTLSVIQTTIIRNIQVGNYKRALRYICLIYKVFSIFEKEEKDIINKLDSMLN